MAISIWLDNKFVESKLLNGSSIEGVEREIMEGRLAEIQGQFLMDFGIEGLFKVEGRVTAPSSRFGTHRTSFKISAADTKTAAILRRNPGWLAKFI